MFLNECSGLNRPRGDARCRIARWELRMYVLVQEALNYGEPGSGWARARARARALACARAEVDVGELSGIRGVEKEAAHRWYGVGWAGGLSHRGLMRIEATGR